MSIMNGGRILSHHTPKEAVKTLEGKIWTKTIERDDLEANEATYNIISSNFNQDNTLNIRVLNDQKPDDTFEAKSPELEDVYFVTLREDESVVSE